MSINFSIVLPTYNSADFICRTLDCILGQTYKNFELIVSDDGSSDDTINVINKKLENIVIDYKIIKNSHCGPGENRNIGIRNSKYEWIAFLDSDDSWDSNKLESVANKITEDDSIGLWCHSEIMLLKDAEIPLDHYKKFDSNVEQFLSIYRNNSLSTSAVTVKKEYLEEVGMFDKNLPSSQDFDLWLRLSLVCKIGYIKESLGYYYMRDGNISSNPKRRFDCLKRINEKYKNILKEKSNSWIIDDLRYKGIMFSSTGQIIISNGNKFKGLIYLLIAFIYWPYRVNFIKKLFKK